MVFCVSPESIMRCDHHLRFGMVVRLSCCNQVRSLSDKRLGLADVSGSKAAGIREGRHAPTQACTVAASEPLPKETDCA